MAERREYRGAAAPAKLSSAITNSATAITIDTTSNWPTGSVGPFFIVIDPGLTTEEKVKLTSRSGSALTVATGGRGADETSAVAHAVGAVVKHVFTANDADLVNKHAADVTQDDHTQYMHNTVARTVSANHNFTGAPVFSGVPAFTDAPTFAGNVVFSGTPQFANMGIVSELKTIDGTAASAGTSPRPMRADAQLKLDLIAVERAVWKAGDFKLTGITGSISSEWLECSGGEYSRSAYPNLFANIGTTYGAGNGTTTFNVPDFRDCLISGAGSGGTRAVGATGGSDTVTLTSTQLPSHSHSFTGTAHSHSISDPGHRHSIGGDDGFRIGVSATSVYGFTTSGVAQAMSLTAMDIDTTGITGTQNATAGGTIGSTGSGNAFSVVPKWRGARVLIKAH